MLEKVYQSEFYARPTLAVARDLLGAYLCRRLPDGKLLWAPIVETEAYTQDDPACHAFRGRTPRCAVMFGPPGFAYVYFIYGMYHCLNVVTEPDGTPGAVLIRAVGVGGGEGPGKLCRLWQIDSNLNGANLMEAGSDIWIGKGEPVEDFQVCVTPRIGLSLAQDRLWRFHIKDHLQVSQKMANKKPSSKQGKR